MKIGRKMVLGIAGAALVAAMLGGAKLRAQTPSLNGFDKPEAAASSFIGLLELLKKNPYALQGSNNPDTFSQFVSLKDTKTLGRFGADHLLAELLTTALTPRLRATTQEQTGNSAVVSVVPEAQSESYKPVVCIQEEGRWRIDLVATYARWNDMDEKTVSSELMPRLLRASENERRVSCQNNMKQLALGMVQYTQDYDERYPPANKWNDVLVPYVRNEQIYQCPSVPEGKYGYAMNWRFSRQSEAAVMNPSQTVTLYDSTTLKRNANGDGHDIAFRHAESANFAFADGHVKAYDAKNAPNFLLDPAAHAKTKAASRR